MRASCEFVRALASGDVQAILALLEAAIDDGTAREYMATEIIAEALRAAANADAGVFKGDKELKDRVKSLTGELLGLDDDDRPLDGPLGGLLERHNRLLGQVDVLRADFVDGGPLGNRHRVIVPGMSVETQVVDDILLGSAEILGVDLAEPVQRNKHQTGRPNVGSQFLQSVYRGDVLVHINLRRHRWERLAPQLAAAKALREKHRCFFEDPVENSTRREIVDEIIEFLEEVRRLRKVYNSELQALIDKRGRGFLGDDEFVQRQGARRAGVIAGLPAPEKEKAADADVHTIMALLLEDNRKRRA